MVKIQVPDGFHPDLSPHFPPNGQDSAQIYSKCQLQFLRLMATPGNNLLFHEPPHPGARTYLVEATPRLIRRNVLPRSCSGNALNAHLAMFHSFVTMVARPANT